jgi:CO/xanthine dehydrogenase Mo-binding subunit
MHTSGPSNKSGLSSASIYVNHDGSIQLNTGSADIGQGSETALSQVAAEALGIPLSSVRVHSADTDSTPYDTGTFASSQMFVGGNAVLLAARSVVENLARALAGAKGLRRNDVAFADGVFTLPDGKLSFSEAASEVLGASKGRVVFGDGSYKAIEAPPVFAVCMVRVRRSELTGAIVITDVIETVDVGTIINRNIVKGQIEGGIAQGLGYGWMEGIETDRRTGKKITSDALLYKIPTAADLPSIHAASVPSHDPYGPFGAKSVGELTLVPVAAALAICVERASGELVRHLPLCTRFTLTTRADVG